MMSAMAERRIVNTEKKNATSHGILMVQIGDVSRIGSCVDTFAFASIAWRRLSRMIDWKPSLIIRIP